MRSLLVLQNRTCQRQNYWASLGTYTTQGDAVKVKLALRKDGKTLATLNVEGTRDQLPALSERLAQRNF